MWARDFSFSASILIRNNDDETLLWRLEGGAVKPGDKDTCWAGCARARARASRLARALCVCSHSRVLSAAQILLLSVVKFIAATLRRGVGRGWIHCRCLVSRTVFPVRFSSLSPEKVTLTPWRKCRPREIVLSLSFSTLLHLSMGKSVFSGEQVVHVLQVLFKGRQNLSLTLRSAISVGSYACVDLNERK